MNEKNKAIADLEAQLTPRGAFEAVKYGVKSDEGRRFIETYAKIRALEGTPVTVEYPKAA